MRHRCSLLLALVAAAMLIGSPPSYGQSPGQPSRSQLDSELARAGGVGEMLQVADRYADSGYRQEAKAIVDRAAQKARSSSDWQSVSAAYLRLGYTDHANNAQRKSRDTSR
jgi:Tfp pilus assembly protein PilF